METQGLQPLSTMRYNVGVGLPVPFLNNIFYSNEKDKSYE